MNKIEITTEFLAGLKEKAEKATPGPWECNAEFIAAANPQVVLALITKIERLEKEAEWMAKELVENGCPHHPCPYVSCTPQCWREAARRAVEEQ